MVDTTRKFAVVLEPEEEGGFTVRVTTLPEIVTYGKNEAEALATQTGVPELVLPALAEEKVGSVRRWATRQAAIRLSNEWSLSA